MDKEKVAENKGGNDGGKWDALKSASELTADEIIARRERNFGKMEQSAEKSTEKKAEKKAVGKAAEILTELEEASTEKQTKQTLEAQVKDVVETIERNKPDAEKAADYYRNTLKEIRQDPEWKKPKLEKFEVGDKDKIGAEMLSFQIDDAKIGAVPREKAVWSFMEYVNDAKTADDFRLANRIASTLEARADITPEERAEILDFRENPAYKFKETGFAVEGISKRVNEDKAQLMQARSAYTEARKGGPLRRLLNRMEIRERKNRMEWWEKRLQDEQGDLKKKQTELNGLIQLAVTPKESKAAA